MTDQEIEERIGWLEAYRSGVEKYKNDNWSYPSLSCDGVGSIIELLRTIPALRARIKELEKVLESLAASSANALEMIRREKFVFRTDFSKLTITPLTSSERWEKLAFSLYARLVEDSEKASQYLEPQETKDGQ